jgi:hypothetical protein
MFTSLWPPWYEGGTHVKVHAAPYLVYLSKKLDGTNPTVKAILISYAQPNGMSAAFTGLVPLLLGQYVLINFTARIKTMAWMTNPSI